MIKAKQSFIVKASIVVSVGETAETSAKIRDELQEFPGLVDSEVTVSEVEAYQPPSIEIKPLVVN